MKFRIREQKDTTYRVVNLGEKPTDDIPVLPDGLGTITKPWLIRWAEWVAAGRPEIDRQATNSTVYRLTSAVRNEFNPALHPRDPETGKFVERSFDLPDDAPNFADMGTGEVLSFLDENGEDIDAVLASDNVSIDGVPTDATSLADLDGGGGLSESISGIVEESDSISEAIGRVESEIESNSGVGSVNYEPMQSESESETAQRLQRLADGVSLIEELGWSGSVDSLTTRAQDLDDPDQAAVSAGYYEHDSDTVYITPSKLNPDNSLYDDSGSGKTEAFDTPEGLIAHETGHARDFKSERDRWNPDNFFGDDVYNQLDEYESAVSEYGMTDEAEFIAEVQAMRAGEKEIPEFVMETYESIGGPEL